MHPEIEHEPLYTFTETPREAYDKIVEYFSKPGVHLGQSQTDRLSCSYRTGEGYKCAVGCLIPDEAYSTEMDNPTEWDAVDGTDIKALASAGMVSFKNLRTLEFLTEAQKVHDVADSVEDFNCNMWTLWNQHMKEWE